MGRRSENIDDRGEKNTNNEKNITAPNNNSDDINNYETEKIRFYEGRTSNSHCSIKWRGLRHYAALLMPPRTVLMMIAQNDGNCF
jgi:hypothetical protein